MTIGATSDAKEEISTEELEHYFDDYLNDSQPMIVIMGIRYCPAYVFYSTDRQAYSKAFITWANESGYTEVSQHKNECLWTKKGHFDSAN